MNRKPIPHSSRGSRIIVKQTKEIFMSQLNSEGKQDKKLCKCGAWYDVKSQHKDKCGKKRGKYSK